MQSASLGGLIKDFRIQKRLSQLEVAIRVGWKDANRLSIIEQGRVEAISRETLDLIMDALELSEFEKGQMLLASNIMPTREEADRDILRLKKRLDAFKFPVFLIDNTWFFYYANDYAHELYKFTEKDIELISKQRKHWLELIFLEETLNKVRIEIGDAEDSLISGKDYNLSVFKYEHQQHTTLKWYQDLLTRLSASDKFREDWKTIANVDPNEHILQQYEWHRFYGTWDDKDRILNFNLIYIVPTFDFRYFLVLHYPADQETYAFYQKKDKK